MNQKQNSKELKAKVHVAKEILLSRGHSQIIPIYKFNYRVYDQTHINRLQNVLRFRVTDKVITERLEDMADQVRKDPEIQ